MSFWPLATSLVERLRVHGQNPPLIELGCGGGDFGRRLRSLGLRTLGVDLRSRQTAADICADALRLPFRDRAVGAMAAGNLMRHLSGSAREIFAAESARCARPGALLLICEDSPLARDESERNYRAALALLAEFDPERGAALSVRDLEETFRPQWPLLLESGTLDNTEMVRDPAAPLRWLLAQPRLDASLRDRCLRLTASVESSGMSYGLYEYALFATAA